MNDELWDKEDKAFVEAHVNYQALWCGRVPDPMRPVLTGHPTVAMGYTYKGEIVWLLRGGEAVIYPRSMGGKVAIHFLDEGEARGYCDAVVSIRLSAYSTNDMGGGALALGLDMACGLLDQHGGGGGSVSMTTVYGQGTL